MRAVIALLLILHGLIHLLGFARAFRLAEVAALKQDISRPLGLLWLLAGLLTLLTAALLYLAPMHWCWAGAGAILLSQIAIFTAWSDAKFGSLVNLVLLVPVTVTLMGEAPSSFSSSFEREVQEGLARAPGPRQRIVEADLAALPAPVATWLRGVGVVGQSRVDSLRMRFRGGLRAGPEDPWMTASGDQVSFFGPATRLFLMRASRSGLPFEALHIYKGATATMTVKLASLFNLVDARGPKMDQSETVTFFNDLCLLAPARLLDEDVRWTSIDASTVDARYTNQGLTVSATLHFDAEGRLTDFESMDRYRSADGVAYEALRWSTPVTEHRDFHGTRLPALAEARWGAGEGEFAYARLEILDIRYNIAE